MLNSRLKGSEEKGISKEISQGIAQDKKSEKIEMTFNLKELNALIDMIIKSIRLTKKEIEKL